MAMEPLLNFGGFQDHAHLFKTVLKYDASAESKTPHDWWDLDRNTIHAILKDISEKVASCTKGKTGLDRELEHVVKTAVMLDQVERASPIKIALIGAQGAGKSLLINALFDCTGLSLTGAKGFACTSAIVKYAYGPGDKFSAEVKFLNAEKREAMVDEHIRSYMDYHNDLDDSEDEDGPRTRSFKQDELERKRKKTAEDFFDTIFGSREEFLDAWSSSPVNTPEFKSLCQLKCKEAMQDQDMNSQGIAMFSKNTPKELLDVIKPFLSNVEGEVCLWPIVDCVTIRFNHPLLQQNLEFIDLPGSGDTNMSRARHADEVKDTVDVEIILGDTVRIGTDEMVISNARAGVLNHGASNVKVVATKIDSLSEDQLAQCSGAVYDEINTHMQQADEDATTAEEEDDNTKILLVSRYKSYLQRYRKAYMIRERAESISRILGSTLQELSHDDTVEIFHTSTANYMSWIKSGKIQYDQQPALSAEHTGVPAIRRFLYNLGAPQNLRSYILHGKVTVPAFVEKLKRVVTQSDRDAGFVTIADEFDDLRRRFLGDLAKMLHWHCLGYSKSSISKIEKDINVYKGALDKRILKKWLDLKNAAWNRILKNRGYVPQGTSKAKGLENTVNWNLELATLLRPGFYKWYAVHSEHLKKLRAALPLTMDDLFNKTMALMKDSAANLITVEKAKLKFLPMQHRMKSKILAMMDEMIAEEKRLLHRATLEDERENNMIATITDEIYDYVFAATPEIKSIVKGKKRYHMPVLKFKKSQLEARFLKAENHFVDRAIATFRTQLDDKMGALIDKHFEKLNAMFDEYSTNLRDHAPVDYKIMPLGEQVREQLEKHLPYIESQAEALLGHLPKGSEDGDEAAANAEFLDDAGDGIRDLGYFIEQVSKSKRKAPDNSKAMVKRIKTEPA
ncbi:uncharacterized protein J4E78_009040 [Alternaria triticimaculans]|uniref:uncharacterized protein n=1 Tax=Alternaria triticimaculans TaxID=297637 RepID=UPI0020C1BC9E|nr:uncharacterized protein J4E78_009040 [Alternaria triticimaculans]KAI4647068.1 hypothetical protein J4E78_009040 [Alternaria triticimaculans]